MKKLITLAALGLTLAMGSAFASDKADAVGKAETMGKGFPTAEEAQKAGEQQAKLQACKKESKTKPSSVRKAFMKECMGISEVAAAPIADPVCIAKTDGELDGMRPQDLKKLKDEVAAAYTKAKASKDKPTARACKKFKGHLGRYGVVRKAAEKVMPPIIQ